MENSSSTSTDGTPTPDPVKCPECGSTQIGGSQTGPKFSAAAMPPPALLDEGTASVVPVLHRGGQFINTCMACGYEWSPAAVRAAKEKSARKQKEEQEDARFEARFGKWRNKLIDQLSPILGNDKKLKRSFFNYLQAERWDSLKGLSSGELNSLIHPSNLKPHPWPNVKKDHPWINFKRRVGCRFYLLMYGLVWPISLKIIFSQISWEFTEPHQIFFQIFGVMAVPIACVPLIIYLRHMAGVSAQKQLESVYHPTAELKTPKRLAGQEIKQGFTSEEKAVLKEKAVPSIDNYSFSENQLSKVLKKYDISDRDAFLKHAMAFDENDNQYLDKEELEKAAAAFAPPASSGSALFFIKRGDVVKQLSGAQIKAGVAKGQLLPDDLVRKSENDQWIPLSKVKGLTFKKPT